MDDLLLGVYTRDEIESMREAIKALSPARKLRAERLLITPAPIGTIAAEGEENHRDIIPEWILNTFCCRNSSCRRIFVDMIGNYHGTWLEPGQSRRFHLNPDKKGIITIWSVDNDEKQSFFCVDRVVESMDYIKVV